MRKIVIVADDLTGANANGSLLTNNGFSAATCLDKDQWDDKSFIDFDAVTLNTDSRLLPKELAFARVHDGLALLLEGVEPKVIAKRIDSTLRGNVGIEIEAALKAVDERKLSDQPAMAVVIPAFPASNRFAVGGYLIVNGIPLEKSPIAKDPIMPITTSRYLDIIRQQTDLSSDYIALGTVMEGVEAVKKAFEKLRQSGVRIVACDAVTSEDIAVIAQALKDVDYPIVAADPGPFTAAMADVCVSAKTRHRLEDNVLVVVGSITELIRRQMEALSLARKCAIIRVNCRQLVNPTTKAQTIANIIERILAKAGTAEVYGVCTVEHPDDVIPLELMAKENNIALHEVSERINVGLAEIGEALLNKPELLIGGIYTSGGEVTVAMARQLHASGFSVRDEVLPLAVYGRLIGGKYSNFPMVTKGGFVGDNTSILECVNYLITKISTQIQSTDKEN